MNIKLREIGIDNSGEKPVEYSGQPQQMTSQDWKQQLESIYKEKQGSGIVFKEHPLTDYPSRTKVNASADATIAIAENFDTAGEKLTKRIVGELGKKYMPVDNSTFSSGADVQIAAARIASVLNKLPNNEITLNIAGNGIYTLHTQENEKLGYTPEMTQKGLNRNVKELLEAVIQRLDMFKKIVAIQTGGQTGYDEAGAIAGMELGIPVVITAPKGYKFRNVAGQDISNEQQFKARFQTGKGQIEWMKEAIAYRDIKRADRISDNAILTKIKECL